MNPERQQALDYLRAPAIGLWRWSENGAVLVWRDGSTIAFREEITQILECLAPAGLPSFGAIALLLAACRGMVPAVTDIVVESHAPLPTGMGKDAGTLLTARQQLRKQLMTALSQLAKVSHLPDELKSGIKAKCVLAEAVFEASQTEHHIRATEVLRGMSAPMTDDDLTDSHTPSTSGSMIRHVHMIAEGLNHHTADTLALRVRTGLDTLPEPASIDLPVSEHAQRLIDELSEDKEFGAVARAARELMAAVRLPRRLGEHDELAIGGVSDISNRGPLDRLLLSELAHDDLTLSVRVALNEALYLRREPPMREPPGTLALLLDSGVRLWGVPRVLASAVALACVACDKQHSELRAWRAHRKDLQPVDLLSRAGLAQHLAELETEAHPGEALPKFAETLANDPESQSVLITHPDALRDPQFRKALSKCGATPNFVATVDRDGCFELHSLPLAHRPPICQAELRLDTIFPVSSGANLIRKDVDPNLPAAYHVFPFPFLLPVVGKMDYWTTGEDGDTCVLLNQRRLMQFKDPRRGARVLAGDLPAGKTLWMDQVEGTIYIVKSSASQRPARLLAVTRPGERARVTDLVSGPPLLAVHRCGEIILIVRAGEVRAYSLADGELLQRLVTPHEWVRGRYFRSQESFYFAAWDGAGVRLCQLDLPASFSPSVIACVFDRKGHVGPWFVHHDGTILSSTEPERIQLPMPPGRSFGLDTVEVSPDGSKVYVGNATTKWGRIKDLVTGRVSTSVAPEFFMAKRLDPPPPIPTWNLYRFVTRVAKLGDDLWLCGRKNRWRKLTLSQDGKMRILDSAGQPAFSAEQASFDPRLEKTVFGHSFKAAGWPGGGSAILDDQGLLHLKAENPNLPEVSLILAEGEVAGWTSEGIVCGPSFFFEGDQLSEPAAVFQTLLRVLGS